MQQASIHPRTLGYLGRALSLELSAVQQYLTQAALTDAWGLAEASNRFRHETVEEMQHAERIVRKLLEVGAVPNASQVRPARVAPTLVALLQQDAELEAEIVAFYAQATAFCQEVGDVVNARFFAQLWEEEHHHAQEIEAWLHNLGRPQDQEITNG